MPDRAWRDVATDLLVAYRNWIIVGSIVATILGAALVLVVGVSLPTIEVPRPLKIMLLGLLGAVMLGFVPARLVIDWLYDPPRRMVVNLGLRESESPAIYRLSPSTWESVEIESGQVYRWENTAHPTFEVESFDPDSLTAVGTWRGSLPDRELLKREKEVEELRSELEQEANRSIDLELSVSSRVRRAVKAIGRRIIDVHAEISIYDGEEIAEVLSDVRRDVEQDQGDERDPEPIANAVDQAAIDGLEAAAREAAATDGGEPQ